MQKVTYLFIYIHAAMTVLLIQQKDFAMEKTIHTFLIIIIYIIFK